MLNVTAFYKNIYYLDKSVLDDNHDDDDDDDSDLV